MLSLRFLFVVLAVLVAMTSAFAPSASFGLSTKTTTTTRTQLMAEPKKDEPEEDGLDLNLEEMFEMFDAADKGKKFDDTVKDVKGGKK
mmetsp:Transcript_30502/g.46704  ORF Transcript_30502/g.46704 Transcript_30502/m.46704 type:complete len:88 (+) Transcript_30502:251-514(+)